MYKVFLLISDCQDKVQRIIETEPLSQIQIQELSSYSLQYVIPHNQGKAKIVGIILFNSKDRPGANEEAQKFEKVTDLSLPLCT